MALSRIIYNLSKDDLDEDKPISICNYLVYISFGTDCEEIIPCNAITKAIKIAIDSQRMCRIFERAGSVAKNWRYLCDVSKGVI